MAAEEERVRSLTTGRISRVLEVEDADQLVFDLRQLRQLIVSDAPLTVESRLAAGQWVRVRQGAFAGLEGTVLKRRGKTRLLVSINFLQQGARWKSKISCWNRWVSRTAFRGDASRLRPKRRSRRCTTMKRFA